MNWWKGFKVVYIGLFAGIWFVFPEKSLVAVAAEALAFAFFGLLMGDILYPRWQDWKTTQDDETPYSAIIYRVDYTEVPLSVGGRIRVPIVTYRVREYDPRPYYSKYQIRDIWTDPKGKWQLEGVKECPASELPHPRVRDAGTRPDDRESE